MLRLRVEEDLSLSEIAESCGVSRQAVHDALRKAENTLDDTEKKLGAVRRYRALRSDAGRAMDAEARAKADAKAAELLEKVEG